MAYRHFFSKWIQCFLRVIRLTNVTSIAQSAIGSESKQKETFGMFFRRTNITKRHAFVLRDIELVDEYVKCYGIVIRFVNLPAKYPN